jgi:hypothetical protein
LDDVEPGVPDADGLALPLGPDDGVVEEDAEVAVAVAAWLNRFMNPKTPTALSNVARQVSVDTLRRPLSRRARSRSRYLMGPYETGRYVKRPPRVTQGAVGFR